MDFAFTAEQDELRETVRTFLRRTATPDRVRGAGGFDRALWGQATAQLGLTALAVPEEHGGFGASLVEVAIALEEIGATLAPAPYLSSALATAALGTGGVELLPQLAEGRTVATLAVAEPDAGWSLDSLSCTARPDGDRHRLDGVKEYVLDGQVADLAVVAAGCGEEVGLFAVRPQDAVRTVHPTLDPTRGLARLTFAGTPAIRVSPPGDGGDAARHAVDLLLAGLAVESVGLARAILALTVDHLATREQFGAPLATFQALRHRVADLAVAIEAATSSAWYAVRVADTDEFAVAAPLAKLVATEAAYAVAAQSIQLHGGIGITWEHPAHLYFKRATANRVLGGDPVALRRLIGARAGI